MTDDEIIQKINEQTKSGKLLWYEMKDGPHQRSHFKGEFTFFNGDNIFVTLTNITTTTRFDMWQLNVVWSGQPIELVDHFGDMTEVRKNAGSNYADKKRQFMKHFLEWDD